MTNNSKQLERFAAFCSRRPDLTFWEAIREWSKSDKIIRSWTDRNGYIKTEDISNKE